MTVPSAIKRITDTVWELPPSYKEGMLVPARIYATEKLLNEMDAGVYDQVTNVACLPGIINYACCMPDGHWGYGFPIGGVAAMDTEAGVISPGGIGFDINCGMRLVLTNLTLEEVQPHLHTLVDQLFYRVPAGVGCHGFVKLSHEEFCNVAEQGSRWCQRNGYAWPEDLEKTEDGGCFPGADASSVATTRLAPSARATTTWKSRSPGPTTSSMPRRRTLSASPSRTRWWSCSTAVAGGSAIRWQPTT